MFTVVAISNIKRYFFSLVTFIVKNKKGKKIYTNRRARKASIKTSQKIVNTLILFCLLSAPLVIFLVKVS